MTADKQYITQISKKDLEEIAAATNLCGVDGVIVTKKNSGIEISIDKQAIRMWVQNIIQGLQI